MSLGSESAAITSPTLIADPLASQVFQVIVTANAVSAMIMNNPANQTGRKPLSENNSARLLKQK